MKINQYLNGQDLHCSPIKSVYESTLNLIKGTNIPVLENASTTLRIKNSLAESLIKMGWKEKFPIDSSVSHNDYASFFIDFYLDVPSDECSHLHRFLLQFMFDNRQAVGTNLLKFDIAARNASTHSRLTTSIAVCGEKGQTKKMGWDGSIATAQEYINAINGPYRHVLSNPPLILAIENLSLDS